MWKIIRLSATFILIVIIAFIQVPRESMASNKNELIKEEGINIFDNKAINPYEQQVITLVNNIRKENGLKALEKNRQLSMVARYKARDMKDRHYFDHYSPTYGSPFSMLKKFGITFEEAIENISIGQTRPKNVLTVWTHDKETFQAILDPRFTDVGVGYVPKGDRGPYWVIFMIF